jgi:putative heme iron utilization protein
METADRQRLTELLRRQRWAALASVRDGEPLASWVAFTAEADFGGFILHLSKLALHTRYLLTEPRASLTVSEPDTGTDNPQELARISIQGSVTNLTRGTPEFTRAKDAYLARLPFAESWFDFADFLLLRLAPEHARYVPGLGRVHRLGPVDLRTAARWTQ